MPQLFMKKQRSCRRSGKQILTLATKPKRLLLPPLSVFLAFSFVNLWRSERKTHRKLSNGGISKIVFLHRAGLCSFYVLHSYPNSGTAEKRHSYNLMLTKDN